MKTVLAAAVLVTAWTMWHDGREARQARDGVVAGNICYLVAQDAVNGIGATVDSVNSMDQSDGHAYVDYRKVLRSAYADCLENY